MAGHEDAKKNKRDWQAPPEEPAWDFGEFPGYDAPAGDIAKAAYDQLVQAARWLVANTDHRRASNLKTLPDLMKAIAAFKAGRYENLAPKGGGTAKSFTIADLEAALGETDADDEG